MPAAPYAWYVVAVLSVAYTVSFIDRQILNLLVEPIRGDLQISDTQISLLQGFTFAIFYSLLGVPIARLADRGNRQCAWSNPQGPCHYSPSSDRRLTGLPR